jgi:hypothetical protein
VSYQKKRGALWEKKSVVLEKTEEPGRTAGDSMIPITKDLNVGAVETGDLERTGGNPPQDDKSVEVRITLGNGN